MKTHHDDRDLRRLFTAARRVDAGEIPPFHHFGRSQRLESQVRRHKRIARLALFASVASLAIAAFALWFAFRFDRRPADVAAAPMRAPAPETNASTAPPSASMPGTVSETDPDSERRAALDPLATPDRGAALGAPAGSPIAGPAPLESPAETTNPEGPTMIVGNFVAEQGEGVGERLAGTRSETPDPASPRPSAGTEVAVAGSLPAVPEDDVVDVTPASVRSVRSRWMKAAVLNNAGSMGLDGHVHTHSERSDPAYDPRFETHGDETYMRATDHAFVSTRAALESRLAGDADTASYTNVRRFLTSGQLPPKNAVRIEEMLNYFDFDYPEPSGEHALSLDIEISECPWAPGNRLARIGVRSTADRLGFYPGSHLVFAIDVSKSMGEPDKLPVALEAIRHVILSLDHRDRISIVTFAEEPDVLLENVAASDTRKVLDTLGSLQAAGRTDGVAALGVAKDLAERHRVGGGVNRILLVTDGDFTKKATPVNVLRGLIYSESIYLTVLGVGTGNLKEDRLEALAAAANGVYHYLDSAREAQLFGVEAATELVTVARDVKLEVGFNPAQVGAWRLIGYENRAQGRKPFSARTDAAELPAGRTMTVLYELVPTETVGVFPGLDARYRVDAPGAGTETELDDLFTVAARLHYEEAMRPVGREIVAVARDENTSFDEASSDFRFASGVAMFGMLLRDMGIRGSADFDRVRSACAAGGTRDARRRGFFELVEDAANLSERR